MQGLVCLVPNRSLDPTSWGDLVGSSDRLGRRQQSKNSEIEDGDTNTVEQVLYQNNMGGLTLMTPSPPPPKILLQRMSLCMAKLDPTDTIIHKVLVGEKNARLSELF